MPKSNPIQSLKSQIVAAAKKGEKAATTIINRENSLNKNITRKLGFKPYKSVRQRTHSSLPGIQRSYSRRGQYTAKRARGGPGIKMGTKTPIRRTDFIMNITPTSTSFQQILFPIGCNSPVTFPWLSQVAQNYETWHLKKLSFEFIPEAGELTTSGVLGEVAMVITYDPDDPPMTSLGQICNYYKEKSFKPSVRRSVSYAKEHRFIPLPTKFVNHDNNINAFNDFGVMVLATAGTVQSLIGKLYVHYEVDLFVPRMPIINDLQIISYSVVGQTQQTFSTNPVPIISQQCLDGISLQSSCASVIGTGPGYVTAYSWLDNSTNYESGLAFNVPGFYKVTVNVNLSFSTTAVGTLTTGSPMISNTTINSGSALGDFTTNGPVGFSSTTSIPAWATYYVDALSSFVQNKKINPTNQPSSYLSTFIAWTNQTGQRWDYVPAVNGATFTAGSAVTIYITRLNSNNTTIGSLIPTVSNERRVLFEASLDRNKYIKVLSDADLPIDDVSIGICKTYLTTLSSFELPSKNELKQFYFDRTKDEAQSPNYDILEIESTNSSGSICLRPKIDTTNLKLVRRV